MGSCGAHRAEREKIGAMMAGHAGGASAGEAPSHAGALQ
jgi:hypothetical protein